MFPQDGDTAIVGVWETCLILWQSWSFAYGLQGWGPVVCFGWWLCSAGCCLLWVYDLDLFIHWRQGVGWCYVYITQHFVWPGLSQIFHPNHMSLCKFFFLSYMYCGRCPISSYRLRFLCFEGCVSLHFAMVSTKIQRYRWYGDVWQKIMDCLSVVNVIVNGTLWHTKFWCQDFCISNLFYNNILIN